MSHISKRHLVSLLFFVFQVLEDRGVVARAAIIATLPVLGLSGEHIYRANVWGEDTSSQEKHALLETSKKLK